MKKFLLVASCLGIGLFAGYLFFSEKEEKGLIDTTQIVQEEIRNVSKLVVTEGYFSDIITYKDAKAYYIDWLSAEKKAIILIKAQPTLSYDLTKIDFEFDEITKTIWVNNIPEPELLLSPELQYYDLKQDLLNPFNANDYNKIYTAAKKRMEAQVKASTFYSNAENRLITELFNLFSKTALQGWSIQTETLSKQDM